DPLRPRRPRGRPPGPPRSPAPGPATRPPRPRPDRGDRPAPQAAAGLATAAELLRMRDHLERSTPDTTVLFLDADLYLDRYDADLEDIVIALWHVVLDQRPAEAGKILADVWKAQVRTALTSFVVNLPDKVPEAVGAVLGQLRLPGIEER